MKRLVSLALGMLLLLSAGAEAVASRPGASSPDSAAALKWERVMELWETLSQGIDIHIGGLPDGLADTDELCLVVLGFRLNPDGSMTDELIGRLEVALSGAEQYPHALIVLTGGGTATENPSATEAGEMAKWLVERGVDRERIVVEDRSLTTAQNAVYTSRILMEQYPQVREIAVISSDYHIPSGILLFGAGAILLSAEAEGELFSVVANAAHPASGGALSAALPVGSLLGLLWDIQMAVDIYQELSDGEGP